MLRLFSRSGFPYCSKAVATVDESDEFQAVVCTKEAIGAIQGGQATGRPRRQIDFRSAVLPLILAEMQIRYYAQSALLANGRAESDEVTRLLGRAWHDGSYETLVVTASPVSTASSTRGCISSAPVATTSPPRTTSRRSTRWSRPISASRSAGAPHR